MQNEITLENVVEGINNTVLVQMENIEEKLQVYRTINKKIIQSEVKILNQ